MAGALVVFCAGADERDRDPYYYNRYAPWSLTDPPHCRPARLTRSGRLGPARPPAISPTTRRRHDGGVVFLRTAATTGLRGRARAALVRA